ncbi:YqeG family HAD IIIA-type phosphatase [Sulfoacidibacillus thermotolerans]|uniref:HAD family hydrolase n=1 Tax=Sulfoacidibacillus thermotolerans TaxID=1765684 RepID=A0A2U3D7E1_SULT2|nr:YqeG family HAD IIIA-type phosphatase [Sulfoacidibacillus thermotolerans]PWI57195.1 hypothetical protein BM613_10025 [Sulfoacidibacillus thermotolerans]
MSVFGSLQPREYVTSIYHIHLERLWQNGMRGIITDLDNTLVEWNSPHATEKLIAWLLHVQKLGFRICILSNNDALRVSNFARLVEIPALHKARKPRRRSFYTALQLLKTTREETAMIGDQLFTDILGGNRMGLYTILVEPIHPQEFAGTRLVRVAEKLILRGKKPNMAQAEYFSFDVSGVAKEGEEFHS